jgi:structural maintenance of chromosomes protein 5
MVRGGTSSTTYGAHRTGSSSIKIKEEKKNKGKQRAYIEEDDEDEPVPNVNGMHAINDDGEGQDVQGETDEEDEEGGSPKGTKRSRVNEDGDSRPADKGKYKERVKTLPRGDDG